MTTCDIATNGSELPNHEPKIEHFHGGSLKTLLFLLQNDTIKRNGMRGPHMKVCTCVPAGNRASRQGCWSPLSPCQMSSSSKPHLAKHWNNLRRKSSHENRASVLCNTQEKRGDTPANVYSKLETTTPRPTFLT